MTIHQADRLPSDIRGYHQRTKHAPNRYALGPAFLDWTSQPSPYRSFAGSPRIMLPLHDGADTPSFPGPAPRRGEARSRRSGIVSRTRLRPQRLEERRGIDLGAAQQSLERQSASDGSLGDSGSGRRGRRDGGALSLRAARSRAGVPRQFQRRGSASARRLSARARLHSVAGGMEIWRARLSLLSARRRPCDRRGRSSRGGARLARACPLRAVRRRNSRAAWPRAGRRRASARARAPRIIGLDRSRSFAPRAFRPARHYRRGARLAWRGEPVERGSRRLAARRSRVSTLPQAARRGA